MIFCSVLKLTDFDYANFTEIECKSVQELNVRLTRPHWKIKEACQAFANNENGRPTNQWIKIKCNPFLGGIRSRQCSSWCDLLASCFGAENNNMKEQWIRMCSSKFRKLSRVEVTVSDVNIEVVPCLPFTKHLFIIKATTGKTDLYERFLSSTEFSV